MTRYGTGAGSGIIPGDELAVACSLLRSDVLVNDLGDVSDLGSITCWVLTDRGGYAAYDLNTSFDAFNNDKAGCWCAGHWCAGQLDPSDSGKVPYGRPATDSGWPIVAGPVQEKF